MTRLLRAEHEQGGLGLSFARVALWWFGMRLDQLGRQMEYESSLVRREMAELLSSEKRACELREEDDRDEQRRKKTRRQETIGFFILLAAVWGWWWYTGAPPFGSLWHTPG
jgi:hypothetical protein